MTRIRFRENADFLFFENFITGARFDFAQRDKMKTVTATETANVLSTKKTENRD